MTQLTQPEPRPYLFLPPSWDAGWRAARDRAHALAGTATLMVAGDSIANGQAASSWPTTCFVELVCQALRARFGRYADFYPAYAQSPAVSAYAGAAPWSAVLNGNSANLYTNNSFTAMLFNTAVVSNAFQSFTSPAPCTALDLIYHDLGAGTFQYTVDGGPPQTVTCTGTPSSAGATTRRVRISGLVRATHTLTYGWQSAATAFGVVGVATYSGLPSGIGISRLAFSGARADHYRTGFGGGDFPANRIELIQGKTPGNDATTNTGWGFPHQPDLLLLELGINDCAAATSLTNYHTQLDRFCQAARRGAPDASLLFLVPWFGNGLSTDVAPGQANASAWAQYVGVITQLAQAYSAALVNIHARWGATPLAQGLCAAATDLHPTDAGHADIAQTLLSIL